MSEIWRSFEPFVAGIAILAFFPVMFWVLPLGLVYLLALVFAK
jgi:hypothetical protein